MSPRKATFCDEKGREVERRVQEEDSLDETKANLSLEPRVLFKVVEIVMRRRNLAYTLAWVEDWKCYRHPKIQKAPTSSKEDLGNCSRSSAFEGTATRRIAEDVRDQAALDAVRQNGNKLFDPLSSAALR